MAAEAVIILDLIEIIHLKSKVINKGGLTIYNKNWKLHKRLIANFIKESQFANEGGTEISRIKQIVKESNIDIQFRFVRDKKITRLFIKDPNPYLVVIYD